MRKYFIRLLCLLVTVGILSISTSFASHAMSTQTTGDTNQTTVLRPAGTTEDADELKELNIANSLTISYDNGNGQLNGSLKVLALIEEQKAMSWQAVYDEFCVRNNVPVGDEFIADIDQYVADVVSKRG